MITAYSLFTSEVDNVSVAMSELKEQLSKIRLLKNSVGIIACHYDYVNTGIVEAVNDFLPFPVIGFTTFFQKSNYTTGLFEMTITVLTGDEVEFSLACNYSENEETPFHEDIKKTYEDACRGHNNPPACIFNFFSVNRPISGDEYIRIMDDASGGVPLFGGITTSDNELGQNMYVISDDKIFSTGFAMLLIFGDVKPKFHYVNYDENKFIDMPGIITKTNGESILEINDSPVEDFLIRRGIEVSEETKDGLLTIPFLFRRDELSPHIARIAYDIDKGGSLKMFGEAPVGAKFRVGTAEPEDIIENSEKIIKQAVADAEDAKAYFIFSCIGRYIALGMNQGTEFENIDRLLPDSSIRLAAYVGGEICPISVDGTEINEFHNSSLIICTLE